MYVHQPPYAAGTKAAEIDLCSQKCQTAASAILFRINWQCIYQVFHVRRIFIRNNSHVWPEANPLAASVHWHQQRFAVMWVGIVHDFLGLTCYPDGSVHIFTGCYWRKKSTRNMWSSRTRLQLTLHVRSHRHLQRSLDWTGWACGLASPVTRPHTNGLLPIGPH